MLQCCTPVLSNALILYKYDYMVDIGYQNLEKSFKNNKNIDMSLIA